MSMAGIREIAAQSGVSPATVSRVLGGSWQAQRIAASTAQRVREAAEALGYRPVLAARSTRTGRTGMLALLVDPKPQRSALPIPLLSGLHAAASAGGYRLVYTQIPDDGVCSELAVRACDAWVVNYHGALPDGLADALHNTGQPCVWLGRDDRPDALAGDEAGAARVLVERMVARGRRQVRMLLPSLTHGREADLGPAFRARLAGWRSALTAAGLPAILAQQAPLPHTAMRAWVSAAAEGADALLLHDASPALLAAVAAAFAHLPCAQWPELACVSPPSACAGLPITTAGLPWSAIGQQAIALLARRLAGGPPEAACHLPFTVEESRP